MPADPLSPKPESKAVTDRIPRAASLAGVALILAAVVVYANSFAVPFIFDDDGSIIANPSIRHLWPIWDALVPPQGSGETVMGRPLLNFSLAVNYALSGDAVWSYHAVNLAVHAFAGVLLFGLVHGTLLLPVFRRRYESAALPLAFAAAAIWTLHPLQTESVTYVIQRAESMMGLCYLLAVYAFMRGATAVSGRRWFALCLAACLAGMGIKEVMVTAPVMVLLYDRTFLAGSFREALRRRGRWHLANAGTWIALIFLVVHAGGRGGSAGFHTSLPWWPYLLTQFRAITHYLGLSFWPNPLILDYGLELVRSVAAVVPQIFFLALLLVGTSVAFWRRPALGFLGCWFFLILAPSSSVVPVATQTIAEHRSYLSLAAVVVLFVLGFYELIGKRSLPIFLTIAIVLGWMTWNRNATYKTALSIWSDAAAKRPDNFRAHLTVGTLLAAQNRLPEAAAELETVIRLVPNSVAALNNLANVLISLNRLSEAIPIYRQVIQLRPGDADPHYNLANALSQVGRVPEALEHYEVAAHLAPADADIQYRLGFALAQLGRLAEASGHFEQCAQLRPNFAAAQFNWANTLAQLGQLSQAIVHYERALEIQPVFPEASQNLAIVREMVGRRFGYPLR